MNCTKCGKSLPANARFCTGCGTKLAESSNSSAAEIITDANVAVPAHVNSFDEIIKNKESAGTYSESVRVVAQKVNENASAKERVSASFAPKSVIINPQTVIIALLILLVLAVICYFIFGKFIAGRKALEAPPAASVSAAYTAQMPSSSLPSAPAASVAPTPVPYPDLSVENLYRERTPHRYHVNRWNANSYKGDFMIGGKRYYSGLGLFLVRSQIDSAGYGMDEVVYLIPDGYDMVSFVIGPDSYWGNSRESGQTRVTIHADNQIIYDTGWFGNTFIDTVSLEIGNSERLRIVLEQTRGSQGTLNIVFGDFSISRAGS